MGQVAGRALDRSLAFVLPVQRLRSFLSESGWDAVAVNTRRLELTWADAPIAPIAGGVLVIDETGNRKDGTKTAHVAHQYLGSVGKIAHGIVAVTSLWADERAHDPLDERPLARTRRSSFAALAAA